MEIITHTEVLFQNGIRIKKNDIANSNLWYVYKGKVFIKKFNSYRKAYGFGLFLSGGADAEGKTISESDYLWESY